jgi:phosphomevalonate kinase
MHDRKMSNCKINDEARPPSGGKGTSLSVPGNLLLLGEYAVLEEGGLGVALAPRVRLRVSVHPADTLAVEGHWPEANVRWSRRDKEQSPLISAIVGAVDDWLAGCNAADSFAGQSPGACVRIDSAAFFSGSRKAGFGSSAALSVGLAAALLRQAGIPARQCKDVVFEVALEGHRRFQGGKGSGYDVATSLHGGIGLFRGGKKPEWEPLRLPWFPGAWLFHGLRSVRTTGAVARYREWKERHRAEAAAFLESSNRCVRGFAGAASRADASAQFRAAAGIGIQLGRDIGVPAAITPPACLADTDYKALGAGNELGLALVDDSVALEAAMVLEADEEEAVTRLQISEEGLSWKA